MLATPMILGQLSSIGMNVIDTLLAGHLDARTLAGRSAVGHGLVVARDLSPRSAWMLALAAVRRAAGRRRSTRGASGRCSARARCGSRSRSRRPCSFSCAARRDFARTRSAIRLRNIASETPQVPSTAIGLGRAGAVRPIFALQRLFRGALACPATRPTLYFGRIRPGRCSRRPATLLYVRQARSAGARRVAGVRAFGDGDRAVDAGVSRLRCT
jgi:hypothetical protein